MFPYSACCIVLLLLAWTFNGTNASTVDGNCAHGDGESTCQSVDSRTQSQIPASALLQVGAKTVPQVHAHLAQKTSQVNKDKVTLQMIRPDPWRCEFIPEGDLRQQSCDADTDSALLDPGSLNCGQKGCSIEQANSFRTMSEIGALPCCSTSPFCAAPECSADAVSLIEQGFDAATCTKRTPRDNVEYMRRPETWPAYHGFGGSFELDTLKYLDLLACRGSGLSPCPEFSFDLALDLGANTGYFTEKLTARDFARNYIMVEANPQTSAPLHQRWGDKAWTNKWFTLQAPLKGGRRMPEFEIVTQALSNRSGTLNMCETEPSIGNNGDCTVGISSVDTVLAGLSDKFKGHFRKARSAFVKIDTEGMDELVMRGMQGLLEEKRGEYEDGKPRHLVNFLMFEFSPGLTNVAKEREGFDKYDVRTATMFLESMGFESFLIGPRFLPLSHGSWHDDFKMFTEDPRNNAGKRQTFPNFGDQICNWCSGQTGPTFTSDIFAVRSTHPHATAMKVALGACEESADFDANDPQYDLS